MTTLLVAAEGRCAASCYQATGPDCTCVCGGRLHGVGFERAVAQAPELVDAAGRPLVAFLELPLDGNVGKERKQAAFEAMRDEEPCCAGCGRPQRYATGGRWYPTGYWCRACQAGRLVGATT